MKIICGKRGKGKTSELIKLCYKNNLIPNNLTYILCPTRNDCIYISELARNLNLNIPFPVSINEFIRSTWAGTFIKNFLVDDIDRCLFELFRTSRFKFPVATLREEFFENFDFIKDEELQYEKED